jgi:hypothetical protein
MRLTTTIFGFQGDPRKLPLCQYAVTVAHLGIDGAVPETSGGSNAPWCYGHQQGLAVQGNVMGSGDRFSIELARPWQYALAALARDPAEPVQWRAQMADPGPSSRLMS